MSPASDQKELKKAYLKLAKRFHPDVYSGVNKDHFKKVNEIFSLLKNHLKRLEYDNKIKISKMREGSKDFKQWAKEGTFDQDEYERMKTKTKTVREEVDPEFEDAFRKLNINRLFDEF